VLKKFFLNTRSPEGMGGVIMLWLMNVGHSSMSQWGLKQLAVKPDDNILDIGCGGGANIARMLDMTPHGKVCGVDYAALSVEKSIQRNRKAIAAKRAEIKQGDVSQIPYADSTFDIVTAFETVYFWQDFPNDLKEVARVLKPGGTFFICNEAVRLEGEDPPHKGFIKMLDLNMYSANDFRQTLLAAGFESVNVILAKHKNMICVMAKKPGARKTSPTEDDLFSETSL